MKQIYLNDALDGKLTTENHNCLIRNGIKTVEEFAEMTDFDISQLRYSPRILELIALRDYAKYYVSINSQSEVADSE